MVERRPLTNLVAHIVLIIGLAMMPSTVSTMMPSGDANVLMIQWVNAPTVRRRANHAPRSCGLRASGFGLQALGGRDAE